MKNANTLHLYGINWSIYENNIDYYKKYKKHTNCLYMLFYTNGYIKIGKTQNFFQRFKTLLQNARLYHDNDIIKLFVSEPHDNYHSNEKLLHNFLNKFQIYSSAGNKSELFKITEDDIIKHGTECKILQQNIKEKQNIEENTTNLIYTDEYLKNVINFLNEVRSNIEYNIHYFQSNNFNKEQIKKIYRNAMLDGRRVLFEKYDK